MMLFAFYGSITAQPIYIGFNGERQIRKVADMKKEVPQIIKRTSPCGDYFLAEVIKESNGKFQKIIYFAVPRLASDNAATTWFEMIVPRLLKIKIDNQIKIPTAEWDIPKKDGQKVIIRMSKKDYQAANCISQSN
jgi:hypothetical protein